MSPARGTVGGGATALGAGVLAAVVAVLGGLVSRAAWRPGHLMVPWGLALAAAAAAGVVILARCASRAAGFAAAAGWVLGLAALVYGRPEGDYIVASDGLGTGFLLLACLAVLLAAVLPHG